MPYAILYKGLEHLQIWYHRGPGAKSTVGTKGRLFHLVLRKALSCVYHYPHFIDEETEA